MPADCGRRPRHIQLYRTSALRVLGQQNAQLGYFWPGACRRAAARPQRHLPPLVPSRTTHPLERPLVMLRSPYGRTKHWRSLRDETGDTIGTYDAEQAPAGARPSCACCAAGDAAPARLGTCRWSCTRCTGWTARARDINGIELSISLGEAAADAPSASERAAVSFLRLFGLDEDAPSDRLDLAQIWQPSPGGQQIGEQQPSAARSSSPRRTAVLEPAASPAGLSPCR